MVRNILFIATLVSVGASLVQAQSIGDMLSSSCQQALLDVAASPEADCLNIDGLVSFVVTAVTSTNDSLVAPATAWLSTFCAETPCAAQALSDITTNLTTGCSDDLATLLGADAPSTADVVSAVQTAYPTVQGIMCLAETANNTFCMTDLLDALQAGIGPLSVDNLVAQLPEALTGQLDAQLPLSFMCSDCASAAYNMLKATYPDLAGSDAVTGELTSQCGAAFMNQSSPADVIEATGSMAMIASMASSTSSSDSTSFEANSASRLPLTTTMTALLVSPLTVAITAFVILA